MSTLSEMTAEIRAINTEKGWRAGDNTFGDYIALLHSELSEALEAYRDHRLADATYLVGPTYRPSDYPKGTPLPPMPKPEGVGSEFADVLIRLLDMADVHGIQMFTTDCTLSEVNGTCPTFLETFGDHIAWLHAQVAALPIRRPTNPRDVLRALLGVAAHYGIDLDAEYQRKIAYNRTRPYQHGGRTLNGASA